MTIPDRKQLKEEWGNIKKYPFSFLFSILFASLIIYFALDKFIFQERFEILKEKISLKSDEIRLLDAQLKVYRNKKLLIGETTFSRLSNKELKEKAKDIFKKFQSIYLKYEKEREKYIYSFDTKDWNKELSLSFALLNIYEKDYKIDMILLREEMLSRLPKKFGKKSDINNYKYPTNPLGIRSVLDDFQMLFKSLPDSISIK